MKWVLENFNIQRQRYDYQGVKAGTYVCKITFDNGEFDNFTIALTPEYMKKVFTVLKPTILQRAAGISEHLEESLFEEEPDE